MDPAEGWGAPCGSLARDLRVEQTEIDALATLQPAVLRRIVDDVLAPFFDATLVRRVRAAAAEWVDEAQRVLDERLELGEREEREREIEKWLALREEAFDEFKAEKAAELPWHFGLPGLVVVEPVIDASLQGLPLVSSSWSWEELTAALDRRRDRGGSWTADAQRFRLARPLPLPRRPLAEPVA